MGPAPGGTYRLGTWLRRATASAVSPSSSLAARVRDFRPRMRRSALRSSAKRQISMLGIPNAMPVPTELSGGAAASSVSSHCPRRSPASLMALVY